MLNVKTFYKNI